MRSEILWWTEAARVLQTQRCSIQPLHLWIVARTKSGNQV